MFDFLKNLVFSKKPPHETNSRDHDAKSLGLGIAMTPEDEEEEKQKNSLMLALLEDTIISSGYFVPAKIPELMSIIRGSTRSFARPTMDAPYTGNVLSKAENRAAGARVKYANEIYCWVRCVFRCGSAENNRAKEHSCGYATGCIPPRLTRVRPPQIQDIRICQRGSS